MIYTVEDGDIIDGIVDLSRRDLKGIEVKLDLATSSKRVMQLCLDHNELEQIPEEIISLNNLHDLSVNGNELSTLPTNIGDLKCLKTLNINENLLSSLPDSICNLTCLRIFSAIGNAIYTLPDGFFSSLEQLTEVYLNENNLEYLPQNISDLQSLRVLDADQNQLMLLPRDIGKITDLEVLSVQENKIEHLPTSMKDLGNIRILNLSQNKIKELPETFGSHSKLERLYIDNNQIHLLPEWMSKLTSIEIIQMNDNKLIKTALTPEFCRTSTKLKTLKLGANFLEELPSNFGTLRNLSVLHLGSTMCELERRAFQNGNWLCSIPDSFTQLTALTKCHLDENQLLALPENFGNLVNLKWLDLGQNRLKEIPNSFCCLKSLEFLQLAKNPLMKLPENFGALVNLIELRMDSTNVSELPNSFCKLTHLKVLDLFNNKLTNLPWQLFELKHLIRLDVDQNAFDLKLSDIPHIIPTNNYPSRDPKLSDNWRGKTRDDKIKIESVIIPSDNSDIESDASFQDSTIEYIETAPAAILMNAVRQGKAMWRSHGGADKRSSSYSSPNKISSYDSLYNRNTLLTESDDEYEPVIYQIDDYTTLKKNKKNRVTVITSNIDFEDEEDWDAECDGDVTDSSNDMRVTEFNPSIETDGIPLNSYPCAEQAKSTTVQYGSLKHHFYSMSLNKEQPVYLPVLPSVQGQFDDAE